MFVVLAATAGFLLPLVDTLRHPAARSLPADLRFASIRAALPDRPTALGYVNQPLRRSRFFFAQYALAPHLLIDGPTEPVTLIDADDARQLRVLCRTLHGRIVAIDAPNYLALIARPETAP